MKKLLPLVLLSLTFNASYAADENQTTNNTTAPTMQSQSSSQSKDAEILAFLMVLDNNEIAAAKEAKTKKLDSKVKNYANTMLKDHEDNLHHTMKVIKKADIKPVNSSMATSLKEQGQKLLEALKPLKDKEFEKAYMDAMVKGHTEALQAIDDNLNHVSNEKVKKFLKATRDHVEKHLKKAEAIQKELNG